MSNLIGFQLINNQGVIVSHPIVKDLQPRLTVVGAGIGDPDLITLKAIKALQSADAVLYDALVNEALLDYAAPGAAKVYVGKRKGAKAFTQEEINERIVAYAHCCGHVVRLKGGDPFVFGRGLEEMQYAQSQGIPAGYIPGVSSAIAGAGAAGIAVTAVNKVTEGRPHIVDMIKNNEIALVINTVDEKRTAITDSRSIRTSALAQKVTVYTTVEGARAACEGMRHAGLETYALQTLHGELAV